MKSKHTTGLLIAVYFAITAYAILALPIHSRANPALAALSQTR